MPNFANSILSNLVKSKSILKYHNIRMLTDDSVKDNKAKTFNTIDYTQLIKKGSIDKMLTQCWTISKSKDCNNLYIDKTKNEFYCIKCKVNGEWFELEKEIQDSETSDFCENVSKFDLKKSELETKVKNENLEERIKQFQNSVTVKEITPFELQKLKLKNNLELSQTTLVNYGVRIYGRSFLLPIYEDNNHEKPIIDVIPLDTEYLSLFKNENNHILTFGLSNPNTLKNKNAYICVTDSILSAMSINQVLSVPSIVIKDLDINIKALAILENYNEIVIWLKDKNLANSLARKLNTKRCSLISHLKSPYECLKSKANFENIMKEDRFQLTSDSIVRFPDLVEAIFNEIVHFEKYSGIKWKRFEQLNGILKGHRKGELTIFTGPTGSGKTTFLSEYSIDLAIQGVNTLWGSFEIQNHRLAKMMMTQFSGINMTKQPDYFKHIAKEFSKLPLFFMNFHGEETLENVIRTMSHAVVSKNVNHIIIDNLQFMMGNSNLMTMNKFTQQDLMIAAFRRFATNFNCHVTLVIHPRKEDSNEPLTTSSIFGSAKASQEADNVIILQEQKLNEAKTLKYIQITKNRFDGSIGRMSLSFDRDSLSFSFKPTKLAPVQNKKISPTENKDKVPGSLMDGKN